MRYSQVKKGGGGGQTNWKESIQIIQLSGKRHILGVFQVGKGKEVESGGANRSKRFILPFRRGRSATQDQCATEQKEEHLRGSIVHISSRHCEKKLFHFPSVGIEENHKLVRVKLSEAARQHQLYLVYIKYSPDHNKNK